MDNFQQLYEQEKRYRQQLEAMILQYSRKLKGRSQKMDADGRIYNNISKDFDKYFEITTQRKGEV